jgi:hypothetical protein
VKTESLNEAIAYQVKAGRQVLVISDDALRFLAALCASTHRANNAAKTGWSARGSPNRASQPR